MTIISVETGSRFRFILPIRGTPCIDGRTGGAEAKIDQSQKTFGAIASFVARAEPRWRAFLVAARRLVAAVQAALD